MATYVIGDVQGCFASLERLIERIAFDPKADQLWFVGDLVNRGPSSLKVLRWVRALGDAAVVVLGNHDLHLIARVEGHRGRNRRDTLEKVLEAPDRNDLCDWLATRPLLHRESGFVMVHAGLHPKWSIDQAEELASEVERRLRSKDRTKLIRALYNLESQRWRASLTGSARYKSAVDVFTRIRTCRKNGELCDDYSGPPTGAPEGCRPWFAWGDKRRETVLFGHWAALGFHDGRGTIGLDTGCVWGGALTAYRLEDGKRFKQPSVEFAGRR